MALDNKLTQNINLRANGDQLLRPFKALSDELIGLVKKVEAVTNPRTDKGRAEVMRLIKEMDKLGKSAQTIQDLMNNATGAGRGRNKLLSGLDEQSFGKKIASASKLKTQLDQTSKSSDALEVRLTQLYKKFSDLGNAGRKVGQRDLSKALNTQGAIAEVRKLEREIERLDNRNARRTVSADGQALRGQLQNAQDALLSRVKGGRRVDFSKEIAEVRILTEQYGKLTRAEMTAAEAASGKLRQNILQAVNQNEAMLRAQMERGASRYKFTNDQARGFDMSALGRGIDANILKLQRLQLLMSKALSPNSNTTESSLKRLRDGWNKITNEISEAIAKKRAFDSLPENKAARARSAVKDALFGDNGMAFAGRIAGAAAITTVVFGMINALQDGARAVVQLEDAFAKLQAIAGATDPEMKKLAGTILTLSENSRYSTLEITEAATQIAQAGYSAVDATTVLSASLALAAGSGSTVAEGVDTMTSSLGAFQLQATEAGHVADVLMEGLNQSKLSINQMQAALQYAGSTAKEAGISLEELTAVAASLANAGIRNGSTIGTGLRQLIVDLQTPTDNFKNELSSLGLTLSDVDIKTKGLAEVVKTLTKAGFSAEAAYSAFEVRAAAAFLAFRNQIDVYDELAEALTKTGAAAEAEARASESLTAKWQMTKNVLTELVSLLAQPLMNALKTTLELINGVVGAVVGIIKSMGDAVGVTSEWGGVIGALLLPAIGALFGPAGLIAGGILGLLSLAGALSDSSAESEKLAAKLSEADQELKAQRQTVTAVDDAIDRLTQRNQVLKENQVALQTETLNLTERFTGLSTELGGVAKSYDDLLNAMLRYRDAAIREQVVKADAVRIAAAQQGSFAAQQLGSNGSSIVTRANQSGLKLDGSNAPNPTAAAWAAAAAFVNKTQGYQHENMSSAALLDEKVQLQGLINNLARLSKGNTIYKSVIDELNERVRLIEQVAGARSKIDQNERMMRQGNAQLTPEARATTETVVDVRTQITNGLDKNNDKAGSGDAALTKAIGQARTKIKQLKDRLKGLNSADAMFGVVQDEIAQLEAEISRVTRVSDAAKRDKSNRQFGREVSADEAAAIARRAGLQVNSVTRPTWIKDEVRGGPSSQERLYNKWVADGKPKDNPVAAPGHSNHEAGKDKWALDIQITDGVTAKKIKDVFAEEGVRTSKVFLERGHFHAEGKRAGAASDARHAKTVEDLTEEADKFAVQAAEKSIQALISEAKAGSRPVEDMGKELDANIEKYLNAQLKLFDDTHPIAGLSAEELKLQDQAREQLKDKLKEDARKFHADFYKQIADSMEKTFELILKGLEDELARANYAAEAGVRSQQQRIDTMGNRYNRTQFGDGALWAEGRKLEDAQLSTDQQKLANQKTYNTGLQGIVNRQAAYANSLAPGSEERIAADKQLLEWQTKLNDALRTTDDLEASIASRTDHLAPPSLKSQLEDSARAWLEQSGAMDSWQKQIANNVGPALDTLTNGFTDFFTSIMDGSKSFKQALGDMLKTFAVFVLQMIAKALALAAVKAILKALGLDMPTAYEGGPVKGGNDASGGQQAFSGGPVGRRYNGGAVNRLYGGGDVRNGFTTRDSSLYQLAHGEYVVRNKSVRDLGLGFMDNINKHGSKGLAKMGMGMSAFTNIQAPKQETNVYVVSEKQKPAMGPQDVLVTIQEDILTGGATKKLIKQVAQGG